jgi:DNA modification methylase
LNPEELAMLPHDVLSGVFKRFSLENIYNYDIHINVGKELDIKGKLPSTFMSIAPGSNHNQVWTDVNRMKTMNSTQSRRNLVMHVCPLQIDIVDRVINRYSNKDDLIFDPFSGLGTVPLRAVKMGRRGIGTELNHGYWIDSCHYLHAAEKDIETPTLFDIIDEEVKDE